MYSHTPVWGEAKKSHYTVDGEYFVLKNTYSNIKYLSTAEYHVVVQMELSG